MKRILILFSILVGILLIGGIVFLFAEPAGLLSYPSKLTSEKQVYDGDTLKDVRIQILDMGSGLINPVGHGGNSGRAFF